MNKKFTFDVLINIVASALPIAILQVVILPEIAKFDGSRYGLILTLISVLSIGPLMMGNSLNNIRLIRNEIYNNYNIEGDFNPILFVLIIISILSIAIADIFYENNYSFLNIILLSILAVLMLFREYYIVAFRLKINYYDIFKCNFLQVVGFIIGIFIYKAYHYWEIVYISGYGLSVIFLFERSNLWKEKLSITKLFKATAKEQIYLMSANFLNRFIDYADKMILFPLLGSSAVSVYYVAVCSTKIILMVISPLNSVILTYLSKWTSIKFDVVKRALNISGFISIIIYFVCAFLSKPILNILYPQYVAEAMNYIYITAAVTAIYSIISVIDPFIIRFFDMKWQFIMSISTVCFYLCICLYFLDRYGLYGFCLGVLITNIFKLICRLLVYYYSTRYKYI